MTTPTQTSTPHILVVDPDEAIVALLKENLNSEGYEVESTASVEEAISLALDGFNLIISEVEMPGELNGLDLLDHVKTDRLTAHIPVMFCSVHDSENDVIDGLNAGADDYIVKPFSLRELLARIRSILRRHRNMAPAINTRVIEYRSLLLNVDSRSLLIDGEPVSLSPTEFLILNMLLRGRNHLYKREEIFSTAWPGEQLSNPRLVDVNISRLRKKLGTYGQNVVNRSGLGYGFVDEKQ